MITFIKNPLCFNYLIIKIPQPQKNPHLREKSPYLTNLTPMLIDNAWAMIFASACLCAQGGWTQYKWILTHTAQQIWNESVSFSIAISPIPFCGVCLIQPKRAHFPPCLPNKTELKSLADLFIRFWFESFQFQLLCYSPSSPRSESNSEKPRVNYHIAAKKIPKDIHYGFLVFTAIFLYFLYIFFFLFLLQRKLLKQCLIIILNLMVAYREEEKKKLQLTIASNAGEV